MTFQSTDNTQSKEVISPHPHDIICGRGGLANIHIGNLNYRELVESCKLLYAANAKPRKVIVSKSIVKAIYSQSPPGRFLEKDKQRNEWKVLDEKKAIAKTSQALREKPIIQTLNRINITSSADKETTEKDNSISACENCAEEFDTVNIEPLHVNISESEVDLLLTDDTHMSLQGDALYQEEYPQISGELRTTSKSSFDRFSNRTIVTDDEESLDTSTRKRNTSKVYEPDETQSKPCDYISILPRSKKLRFVSDINLEMVSSLFDTNDYEPVEISYHCQTEEALIEDGLKILFPEYFKQQYRAIFC